MTVPELITLIQALKGGGDKPADPAAGGAAAPAKPKAASTNAQLAEIKQLLTGGAPAAPAPAPAPAPAA